MWQQVALTKFHRMAQFKTSMTVESGAFSVFCTLPLRPFFSANSGGKFRPFHSKTKKKIVAAPARRLAGS